MSRLEDYVADIHSTLIQRKIKICVPKQIPDSVLEKAPIRLAHVEAWGAVRWRGKTNCYFKDNAEVVTRKGGVERPSWCRSEARREEENAKSSLPCLMCVGLRTSFRK